MSPAVGGSWNYRHANEEALKKKIKEKKRNAYVCIYLLPFAMISA